MNQLSNIRSTRHTARLLSLLAGLAVIVSSGTQIVSGQTESPITDLKKTYDEGIEQLRTSVKAMKRAGALYYHSESAVSQDYKSKWETQVEAARTAFDKVRRSSFELFLATEKPDADLQLVVERLNKNSIELGQLTTCYEVTRKLLTLKPTDEDLTTLMGRVSILTNDFDTANQFAQGNEAIIRKFPMPEIAIYSTLDETREKYARELKLRAEDAKADDLPRVELDTSKGKIVIELFENEAPETVANFISLVESGYYDGLIFHRVLKNILAQTGATSMTRRQTTGYTIYDECKKPDARHHFRGTVSMAIQPDKTDTGSSEFIIMQVAGPNMDNRHTVFGRVISDLRVLDDFQVTRAINDEGKEELIRDIFPETIHSTKVLRKRDHEYEPNRVKK